MPCRVLYTCVLSFVLAQAVSVGARADEAALPGPVPAELVSVVDGDTIAVRARIWPGHVVETRVRLDGVDTPEIRRPACEAEREAGREAAAFTEAFVEGAGALELRDIRLGSFAGRVVARVAADKADLSRALMEAGLAVAYGEDGPWCAGSGEDDAAARPAR